MTTKQIKDLDQATSLVSNDWLPAQAVATSKTSKVTIATAFNAVALDLTRYLTYGIGSSGTSISGTDLSALATGDLIRIDHLTTSNRINQTSTWRSTGVNTPGSANPTSVDSDGYLYDFVGNQFELVGDAYVDMFGDAGDVSVDSQAALEKAAKHCHDNKKTLHFNSEGVYVIDGITFDSTLTPKGINLNGATIRASGNNVPANGTLIYINNPQTHLVDEIFTFSSGTIDADTNINTCLQIQGAKNTNIQYLVCINALGDGVIVWGGIGHGVYGTKFDHIVSENHVGRGFYIYSTLLEASYRNAVNTYIDCESKFNEGSGWYIDYASGTWIGCRSERNDGYGYEIDNSVDVNIVGGFTEHNHQDYSDAGISDGSDDVTAILSANSTGVYITGGRHIGDIDDSLALSNPNYIVNRNQSLFYVQGDGQLRCSSLQAVGGLGLGGSTPVTNQIKMGDGGSIHMGGVNMMRGTASPNNSETHMEFRFVDELGSNTYKHLIVGAPDSDGAGFRTVKIPN